MAVGGVRVSFTVQLSPEIERNLREQAALAGKEPKRLALEAIEERLNGNVDTPPRLSKEEWHRRFDARVASMPQGNLKEDLSRDSVRRSSVMRILVDTNILGRLSQPEHPLQQVTARAAKTLLDEGHELRTVPQVLYEYWAIATR